MPVLQSLLAALLDVAVIVIDLYIWVLVIGAVLSWLIAFNVVNRGNRFVTILGDMCFRLTEPALRPIRRKLPLMGGLDLSPVVLILGLMFVKFFLLHLKVF